MTLKRAEVVVERFRGGGPGGQHRNKTETCVRLTHIPTGLEARGTSERSLTANLESAWRLLAARVNAHAARERAERVAQRRADRGATAFGAVVRRSYFLAGDPRAVDGVTGLVADPRAVLAGRLELMWGRG